MGQGLGLIMGYLNLLLIISSQEAASGVRVRVSIGDWWEELALFELFGWL